MKKGEIDLLEALAAIEHDQWIVVGKSCNSEGTYI
jgi:hypothetical protein